MKIDNWGLVGAACGAALSVANPAAAASEFTVTYTGTVGSSYDQTGVFGPAGSSLEGDAFTAVFNFAASYLPNQGVAYIHQYSTPNSSGAYTIGGSGNYYQDYSPVVSSFLTINGITEYDSGNYGSFASVENYNYTGEQFDQIHQSSGQYSRSFFSGGFNAQHFSLIFQVSGPDSVASLPSSLTGGFNGSIANEPLNLGRFSIQSGIYTYGGYDASGNYVPGSYTNTVSADGDLNATHLTISAVPEPGEWAMMLTGMAAVGTAMRRRRYASAGV